MFVCLTFKNIVSGDTRITGWLYLQVERELARALLMEGVARRALKEAEASERGRLVQGGGADGAAYAHIAVRLSRSNTTSLPASNPPAAGRRCVHIGTYLACLPA